MDACPHGPVFAIFTGDNVQVILGARLVHLIEPAEPHVSFFGHGILVAIEFWGYAPGQIQSFPPMSEQGSVLPPRSNTLWSRNCSTSRIGSLIAQGFSHQNPSDAEVHEGRSDRSSSLYKFGREIVAFSPHPP